MKLTTLVWTTAATVAAAAAGGAATDPNSGWYLRLRKPGWQPPALAFPVVWTALYADLAVSSAVALDSAATKDVAAGRDSTAAGTASTNSEGNRGEVRAYQGALAANLVLNATWSWLFWRSRRPWLAAAEAGLLAASSADLVRRTYRLNPRAGAALAPYAAWCGFDTVLSTSIARLNSGRGSR